MRIGDFARLGNVSLRTLRFYGQAGLLRPANVNPDNGYRHYDPRQLAQLHQIHAGRLARIDARLRALEGKPSGASHEVLLRQTRPVWVVSLREKIRRYEEAEAMFEEVERRVGTAHVFGERAALWHSCANEGPAIDCEVLRFLRRPVSARGTLRAFQLPAATVASVFHLGDDRTLDDAYRTLAAWLASGPFRLAGPKREV